MIDTALMRIGLNLFRIDSFVEQHRLKLNVDEIADGGGRTRR